MRSTWVRPSAAIVLASLARYQAFELIEKRLVKVAYLFNRRDRVMQLIYGPSLWEYLEALTTRSSPETSHPERRARKEESA